MPDRVRWPPTLVEHFFYEAAAEDPARRLQPKPFQINSLQIDVLDPEGSKSAIWV